MRPGELGLLRLPGRPTLSPDGAHVVAAITSPDLDADEYHGRLWRLPADGSAPPAPLTGGPFDAAPVHSPDGRWLAFLRRTSREEPPQLYVMPTDGGEPRKVTGHPLGVSAPAWSPDSRRLAYLARVPEQGRYGTVEGRTPDREPPRRITRLDYRLDNIGFLADRPAHIFVVEPGGPGAEHPEPLQVTKGDDDHKDPSWSLDGRSLVYSRKDADRDGLTRDVFVAAADGQGEPRRLTSGGVWAEHPTFTPHGVAFLAHIVEDGGRRGVARTVGLWLVDEAGGAPRRITDEETYDLAEAPFHTDDAGAYVLAQTRGAMHAVHVPFDGGAVRTLLGGPRVCQGFAVEGGTLAASVGTAGSPGEVVTVTPDGTERTVTRLHHPGNGFPRPMASQELEATAPDGYPVHGWVVRPEGDGPHPVLLMIHGGPFAQYTHAWFDEAQVYAAAGYAVVMGNPRGSNGYGQAHGRSVFGDVGARSAVDLLALLDHALTDPSLDGSRVGVLGGSHGGFMTTWMAAHHGDRFRAAITERAVNAIESMVGSSDIGWYFCDDLYGTDPEARHRQSPLSYADKIDIPVLVIHSEQDWRCPVEQAQRLFVALKLRGTPTELLLFPGEGHEMSRSGLPSHRVARFDAILDWWDRHLR
ncbi:MAG: alpha/beta fold hydrolase [Streptosporangiales bacterium]|nr:alpha/beta fold hydrolase [Streptosporangiales bacterium]